MRRKDREITSMQDLLAVMEECDVCRIALNTDDGYPYILPLNFGMQVENGMPVLYFHSALEGAKCGLMAKDPRASFEMDCGHRLVTDEVHRECTMEYRSVIGRGRLELVPDEKKLDALRLLMAHYHKGDFPFSTAPVPRTLVYRLVVSELTGKARQVRQW